MNIKNNSFQVRFTYKDGKDININILEEKLDLFFSRLNEKRIFWGISEERLDKGFWTNMEDVRFVQIDNIQGVQEDGSKQKTIQSSRKIHDKKTKDREGTSKD